MSVSPCQPDYYLFVLIVRSSEAAQEIDEGNHECDWSTSRWWPRVYHHTDSLALTRSVSLAPWQTSPVYLSRRLFLLTNACPGKHFPCFLFPNIMLNKSMKIVIYLGHEGGKMLTTECLSLEFKDIFPCPFLIIFRGSLFGWKGVLESKSNWLLASIQYFKTSSFQLIVKDGSLQRSMKAGSSVTVIGRRFHVVNHSYLAWNQHLSSFALQMPLKKVCWEPVAAQENVPSPLSWLWRACLK